MGHIQRRILDDGKNFEALLNLYGRIRKGLVVAYDPDAITAANSASPAPTVVSAFTRGGLALNS